MPKTPTAWSVPAAFISKVVGMHDKPCVHLNAQKLTCALGYYVQLRTCLKAACPQFDPGTAPYCVLKRRCPHSLPACEECLDYEPPTQPKYRIHERKLVEILARHGITRGQKKHKETPAPPSGEDDPFS